MQTCSNASNSRYLLKNCICFYFNMKSVTNKIMFYSKQISQLNDKFVVPLCSYFNKQVNILQLSTHFLGKINNTLYSSR